MSSKEQTPIVSLPDAELEKRRQIREKLIKERLWQIYVFVGNEELIGNNHLDIGTYDGFALPVLAQKAKYLTSIDMNPKILEVALAKPEIQALLAQNKLFLLQMDGRELAFPNNSFDSISLIEVFGGSFEGTEEDIRALFKEARRVLRPGCPLIFTIKSLEGEELFDKYFNWHIPKGYPQHREEMTRILNECDFSSIEWYGHVVLERHPDGRIILPFVMEGDKISINKNEFVPRHIDGNSEEYFPLYWVGVAR